MGGGAKIDPHAMQLQRSCSIAYRGILYAKDVIYRGRGREGDEGAVVVEEEEDEEDEEEEEEDDDAK